MKSQLKKQHAELEQLRVRYLAAEESNALKKEHTKLEALRSELESIKMSNSNHQNQSSDSNLESNNISREVNGSLLSKIDPTLKEHIARLNDERDTLLRTGVYLQSDQIIVELDRRIKDCLKEAKLQQQQQLKHN